MMADILSVSSLVNNIIGGFASGVAVAIVVGSYFRINRCFLRRNQVRYFREVVSKSVNEVRGDEERGEILTPVPNRTVNPDQLHQVRYESMRRTLNAAVNGRSSELKYDELCQLDQALYVINWLIDEGNGISKEAFDQAIDRLKSIDWLKFDD